MSGLEGYNPEFLEQLERIHDHADMVACLSKDSTLDSVCRFVPEWRSLVDDGDPEWAFYAEIASDGGVESHAVNHRLLIWKERGECGDVFAFNDSSREPDVDRAERNRDLLSDLPMLVGIGEAVDMPEGSVLGSGWSLYGCHCSMSLTPWTTPWSGPLVAGALAGSPTAAR